MKKKPVLVVLGSFAILACVSLMGIRHDLRNPNQHWNQYWAVRELNVWSFFGQELYASNRLAVYDMSGTTTSNLPQPINTPAIQVRRFGKTVEGDSQFNLGEDDYRQDECIDYIIGTLAVSKEPKHRFEAARNLYSRKGHFPSLDKAQDKLLSDSNEDVRTLAADALGKRSRE